MATNQEVASVFERMSEMLELLGEDRFRVNAHARAARVIADHPARVVDLDEKALLEIDGVGKSTAKKIREFAETGRIKEHDELAEQVPQGLLEMLRIPGLGPKTVQAIWKEKGVTTLDGLKRIIEDGAILDLPRMGAKTVENIRQALTFQEAAGERIPLGIAMPIAETLVERMAKVKGVRRVEYAGSLRRGRETIGDLDLIAVADDPSAAAEAFTTMPEVTKVLGKGEKKCSVRLDWDGMLMQSDLRIVPEESYGAAMLYFTGSKAFNVRLRERALKKKLTLNEYGLFPEGPDSTKPPQEQGVEPVAAATEHEILATLGVIDVPPELREDRPEPSEEEVAALVALEDIRAELHAHTTASDGRMSIEELAQAAKRRGYHTIAVTDHSQSSVLAGGLKPDDLRRHIEAVREVDARMKGIKVLAGSEVDILVDGSLDYEDDLLAELDVVVASPHASLRQEPEKATERLLRAIEHPLVHIIGHPTGRLIGKREGFFPDIERLAEAAAEHGVALEINANWRRLDLRDAHVRVCVEKGALIAINCDVHVEEYFGSLRYGVLTARRAGLPKERCVNTWTAKKLHAWLKSKRG